MESLQDPSKMNELGAVSPSVEKLQIENSKLKYQLNHLQRVRFLFLRRRSKNTIKYNDYTSESEFIIIFLLLFRP